MTKQYLNSESLLANESFQRFLSHQLSAEENEQWLAWLRRDHCNQELYQEALELWQFAQFKPTSIPYVNEEWQKLQYRLRINPETRASIIDINSQSDASRWDNYVTKSWIPHVIIAASIILVILVWQFFSQITHTNSRRIQTATTDFSQRMQLKLPENISVILNANSTIRYPTKWTKDTSRFIELQGEAFFDVAPYPKGLQNRFIVSTNDGEVKVVGTRFSVYNRGQGTRVAVEAGSVEIIATSDINKSVLLKQGEMLYFQNCLLYTSPSPRDRTRSRMPSSA